MTPPANIVIPVKGFTTGKSRLADVLSPDERSALNRRLATRVLETALETASASEADIDVYVLSPDETIAEFVTSRSAHFLHQKTRGLNAGLSEAILHLANRRTVFLAADLPALTTEDITALIDTSGVGLAPDQRQTGTNALSVPEPGSIAFAFGADSLQIHRNAARETGLPVVMIKRPGLALDLDTNDDLAKIRGWP